MNEVEAARKVLDRYALNPSDFVCEQFGITLDSWQREGLDSLPNHNRICFKSAKGPGKTAVLAMAAWWFLTTRVNPKIIATSISGENLADGLWAEMAKWQQSNEFLAKAFTWNKTSITSNEFPATWFMSARKWSKSADQTQQANTLAGKHAESILFILDEVGGIPDAVMASAEAALATGGDSKIIMAGNPTHREGPLYRACTTERKLWKLIEITGDPDSPDRSDRISKEWANQQIEKYGRHNPWVLVNVFGEFPPSSINTLLGHEEVLAAMKRTVKEDQYAHAQKRMGVDCARFGDDRTVIFKRQGLMSFQPITMRNARTNEIAARVMLEKKSFNSEMDFVDGTGGWGMGVVDSLIAAGVSPIDLQYHGPATDPRYKNKRAEMWMEMAEWVKKGGCLPNIPELIGELTTPTYTFVNGKFQLEPKDQVKERLGRSPDLGDALAQTFAYPEVPGNMGLPWMQHNTMTGRAQTNYDPLKRKLRNGPKEQR